MAARSHLSIGAVLSLLREEFPDVTISKIRFLESQGLVDPERTPSGYRKFYEHDVDRLRWILRQQRENFLPLKVIKGRLSEQDPDGEDTPDGADTPDAADTQVQLEWDEVAAVPLGAHDADRLAAEAPGSAPVPAGPPVEQGARTLDAISPPPALLGPAPARTTPESDIQQPPDRDMPAPAAPAGAEPGPGEAASVRGSGDGRSPAGSQRAGPPPTPLRGETAPQATAVSAPPPEAPAGAAHAASERAVPDPEKDGDVDAYTAADLAVAAGVDLADVDGLRSFGLLASHAGVGGSSYYDADALEVVRLAAAFARHGVEARHLRSYKTGAEREASLFEQVVMPLMHQRNPNARRQAIETLGELAGYGAQLREVLVRQSLRNVR